LSAFLAQRLRQVKPSPSMAAKARVESLRAAGRPIVEFTLGEPDFPTPPHVVAAGIAALQSGQTRYTGANGTPALRRAIAAKLARENGLAYSADEIAVGCGAKQIIYTAFAATLNDGDEVIVPAPYWVSYPDMVAINGGIAVIAECDAAAGFKLTPHLLERSITPRTRWLILNPPNNPSGAVYADGELRALTDVLLRHPHVGLMTDEIYEHFVYGGARHVSALRIAPALARRTLVVNGLSKAYAMTGWRVGYGAGPAPLIEAISLLLSQSTTCPSALSQAAAVVALEGPQQCVADAAAAYGARRDRIVDGLRRIPGFECAPPEGAFYAFPSVAGLIGRIAPGGGRLASDTDVVMYLLEQAGVATVDGTSYGRSPHLRISFATSVEQIEMGCERLRDAVARLTD
jgi:aspartate aminotransferase